MGGAKITSVHDLAPQEEREVLGSIYDSDDCFKEQSATSFTYRVSNDWGGLSDRLLHVGGLQNTPTCLHSNFHLQITISEIAVETSGAGLQNYGGIFLTALVLH